MHREEMRARLDATREPWEILVIGGGATGLGCALDAAARGFRTVLVEAHDFAAGTSSRSTKLFHGGVRYLRGGHFQMVAQSLRERETARRQAKTLVHETAFLVPAYRSGERFYYAAGLKLYDWLARDSAARPSHSVSRREALRLAPTLRAEGLRGGTLYHDLQFDDARFALELARAAVARGAVVLNHATAESFLRKGDRITGAVVRDEVRGDSFEVRARVVINATGIFADDLRRLANNAGTPLLRLSRGAHIVLERSFLPGDTAILVPRTDDDRVVFLIPWRGRVLVGTTDTAVDTPTADPLVTNEDVDYLLEHASRYLSSAPGRADVKSAFAGLRPLPAARGHTANLRRDHRVEVAGGMVTICGGKWTTYRLMAKDAIDAAAREARLGDTGIVRAPAALAATPDSNRRLEARILSGTPLDAQDAREIERLARDEMAITVEDVLARRTRSLFLDARRSAEAARPVAIVLAHVQGQNTDWIEQQLKAFAARAASYLP